MRIGARRPDAIESRTGDVDASEDGCGDEGIDDGVSAKKSGESMTATTILTNLKSAFREWRARRAETSFERGYWERIQRADAALLPLSQIGKGTSLAFTNSRPGTLTITVGNERVTLDPTSSHEKYMRDRAKADELIDQIKTMSK